MNEKIPVRQSFMDKVIEHYCPIQTLNHDRNKSTGVVLKWRNRWWTCTGGVSCSGWEEVDLRQVMLESEYKGPPPNPDRRGPDYYTGMRFRHGKTWWVLTGYEITLVPDNKPEESQPALF